MTKLYGALLGSVLLLSGCGETSSNESQTMQTEQRFSSESRAGARNRAAGTILFLGDSITAGLGVAPEASFPSLVQNRIDSLGWDFEVVNAGVSGDTSSGGLRRLEWLLRRPIDVMVLELGANDGLRGISPAAMKANLAAIIDATRAAYPDVRILLAGMRMPPNLGQEYTRAFEAAYHDLALEKEVLLIPFILEGVGGVRSMNQGDGIHPNPTGHAVIAETVWSHLEPVLTELRAEEQPA